MPYIRDETVFKDYLTIITYKAKMDVFNHLYLNTFETTNTEIADRCNLQPKTVARYIKSFKEDGFVDNGVPKKVHNERDSITWKLTEYGAAIKPYTLQTSNFLSQYDQTIDGLLGGPTEKGGGSSNGIPVPILVVEMLLTLNETLISVKAFEDKLIQLQIDGKSPDIETIKRQRIRQKNLWVYSDINEQEITYSLNHQFQFDKSYGSAWKYANKIQLTLDDNLPRTSVQIREESEIGVNSYKAAMSLLNKQNILNIKRSNSDIIPLVLTELGSHAATFFAGIYENMNYSSTKV